MVGVTQYKEEYIKKVDEYLADCQEKYEEFHKTRGDKSDTYERIVKVNLPSIEGFARFLDVNKTTLYKWEDENEPFSNALEKIRIEQHNRLVEGGLSGTYSPVITKLMMSNNHGYAEKTQTDLTTKGEKVETSVPAQVVDELEADLRKRLME